MSIVRSHLSQRSRLPLWAPGAPALPRGEATACPLVAGRSHWKWRLGLGLIVALAVCLQAPVAHATSFDEILVEQLTQQSDLVVRGRVVETRVHPEGPGLPGIHTEVVLEVSEALRGSPGRLVRFWVHGGEVGRLRRVVRGQARFSAGEDVIVFLRRTDAGALWPTGMERGKWVVHEAAAGGEIVVQGGSAGVTVRLSVLASSVRGGAR